MRSFLITLFSVLGAMAISGAIYAGFVALSVPPVIPAYVEIYSEETVTETETSTAYIVQRKPLFYTFLLFGLDSGNNADVIMVGAIDVEGRQVSLISIPRDTRVETERRLRKPVAAYAVGRGNGRGHEGGVEAMKADVQSLFGFWPDFYVMVNYAAFERVVNSVGGVQIYVPFHMRYDDPWQNLHINIAPGLQTLSGRQALHFARYRMGNPGFRTITDYERIENQQKIVRALFDELLRPQTILRVPELVGIYRDYVSTNLTYREKLWFADQLNRLRGTQIAAYTLPVTGTSGPPAWYELPCRDGILEIVNRTINPFTQEITAEMVRIADE